MFRCPHVHRLPGNQFLLRLCQHPHQRQKHRLASQQPGMVEHAKVRTRTLHLWSGEVVNELAAPDFPNSQSALEMLRGLRALEITAEIKAFAELLVAQKVMPAPAFSGDAMHVANCHLASPTIHPELERQASGQREQANAPRRDLPETWSCPAADCHTGHAVGGIRHGVNTTCP